MNEQDQTAIKAGISEVKDDIVLAQKLAAQAKTDGWKKTISDNAPEIIAELKQDFEAGKAVAPLVKAGYKTTEFWLIVAILGINAYKPLPWETNTILAGVTAVYTFIRGAVKKGA